MLKIHTSFGIIKRNNGINYFPEELSGAQLQPIANAMERVFLPKSGEIFLDKNNLVYERISGVKVALTVKPEYIGN